MKPCPNIIAQVAARLASGQIPTADIAARAGELVTAAKALVEAAIAACPTEEDAAENPAKGGKGGKK